MVIEWIDQTDKIIDQAEYAKYKPDPQPVEKYPLKHTASPSERQPEDGNHQHPQTYRGGEFEKIRAAKPVGQPLNGIDVHKVYGQRDEKPEKRRTLQCPSGHESNCALASSAFS